MAFCVGSLGCNSFFLHPTVFNLLFHSLMCNFSVLDTISEPRLLITPPERANQPIASEQVNPEWHTLQTANFVPVSVQEPRDFRHDGCREKGAASAELGFSWSTIKMRVPIDYQTKLDAGPEDGKGRSRAHNMRTISMRAETPVLLVHCRDLIGRLAC